jgi:hypothetical protein
MHTILQVNQLGYPALPGTLAACGLEELLFLLS